MPHGPQVSAEVGPVAGEEQPWRRVVLLAAADERDAVLTEHAEVTYERLQPASVAGRRDHGFRLDAGAVGEQHARTAKALDRGDDLNLSGLQEGHERSSS